MTEEGPTDLSALDALFSRHGQGQISSGKTLSPARKQEIYAGTQQEEAVNPTHETLRALISYEEKIPDQEVDEFVSKIRNTQLLDDYSEDSLGHTERSHSPAFNPWPLDDDAPSPAMADPLSGDIVVTDLNSKQESKAEDRRVEEEEETEDSTNGALFPSGDAEDADSAESSPDDGEDEAEDLTEEFKVEKEGGGDGGGRDIASDHHGDVEETNGSDDSVKEDSDDWELIPRVDDDVDGEGKDHLQEKPEDSNTQENLEEGGDEDHDDEEEEEEEEEEEKDEKAVDEMDSSVEPQGEDSVTRMEEPIVTVVDEDSKTEPENKGLETADTTEVDGQSSLGEKEHANLNKAESQRKSDLPDFETFLEQLGVSTLDVEAQKSRARLSRVGPLAQRRPITKRFSGGDDEEKEKWMFTDSTEPRPKKHSIDENEEEEGEEKSKVPPPQPASKPSPGGKRPPGGIGLGPMILPGLGAALGGTKLKKTPTSSPNKTFQSSVEDSKASAESTKASLSPQASPRRVLPSVGKTPPKPTNRPKPQPKPAPPQEPTQPAWMRELKQKSPKKTSEVKSVSDVKEDRKKDDKDLNSDILHPAPSEEKKTPPPWMTNGKARLPPISASSTPSKEEESSASSSVPPWKQELMKKKKSAVPTPSTVNKTPSKPPPRPITKPAVKPPAKPPMKPPAKPAIAKKPAKQPDKKREEDRTDGLEETDSKKIKLSANEESAFPEEKMDIEVTPPVSNGEKEEPKEDKDKGIEAMKKEVNVKEETGSVKEEEKERVKEELNNDEGEEKKEIKVEEKKEIKVEEKKDVEAMQHNTVEKKKVTIVRKPEEKKEDTKPTPKPEELRVKIVRKSEDQTEKDEGEKENVGLSKEEKKNEKSEEIPESSGKPKQAEKPKPNERPKLGEKPVKIIPKTNGKREENGKGKQKEKKVTIVEKSDSVNEDERASEKKVTILTKNTLNKEGMGEPREKDADQDLSNVPKWKREALERKQKRKMSGGYAPLHKPSSTIDTNMNSMPQWKRDLMEKKRQIPKMPSVDAADREEKGAKESSKTEKALKRHTIAADVSVNVPSGHKTGAPTWKQELEKRKIGRLAKHLENKDAGPEIQPPSEQSTETMASASS